MTRALLGGAGVSSAENFAAARSLLAVAGHRITNSANPKLPFNLTDFSNVLVSASAAVALVVNAASTIKDAHEMRQAKTANLFTAFNVPQPSDASVNSALAKKLPDALKSTLLSLLSARLAAEHAILRRSLSKLLECVPAAVADALVSSGLDGERLEEQQTLIISIVNHLIADAGSDLRQSLDASASASLPRHTHMDNFHHLYLRTRA